MDRPIAIVGAPSSIGIRPYDEGGMRRLDLAPGVLRDRGIETRLGARDLGDVVPPPYRDFVRPPGRPRNENDVANYSRELAAKVRAGAHDGSFVLVLGGDCSIVLGGLLGARRPGGLPVGLVYVDAHGDFATPEESATGSAASMCLALATGRGDTPLARLGGETPLARPEDVVIIGRRDDAEPYYGQDALRASAILDLPHDAVRERGTAEIAQATLERLTRSDLAGFWIHVDADVLDPSVMPAVDSPEPNGLSLDELAELLTPLARHPKAVGLEVTIYDPALDPDRSSAARLVTLLERVLGQA
ncbi:MAG: arginase family protein [Gemmatimonadota bacterium]|nr:arginase family protein [Gemmatimonadota bacterium]